MKYFAYGANTSLMGMANRCPDARALGPALLLHHSFRFAVHADVVYKPGFYVNGLLWEITPECLQRLDYFEGYPHYYSRKSVQTVFNGENVEAFVYHMQPGFPVRDPGSTYFNLCLEGYLENNIPTGQLFAAQSSGTDKILEQNNEY